MTGTDNRQDPAEPTEPAQSADATSAYSPANRQRPRGTQFPPGGIPQPRPAGRRSRRKIVLISALTALVVLTGAGGGMYMVANHLTGNIRRISHVFQGLNKANRPVMPAATRRSMTILLAGSDVRSVARTTGSGTPRTPFTPGAQRSDVLMLVHIDANRQQASFISIPRDSWVDVPGHGMMKINAALSLGGPSLMIKTVERLTHVLINHYAVLNFQGFRDLVSSLGGVAVQVAASTSASGVHFKRGLDELTPSTALTYVRQRDGLPLGDLSRIQRQQNLIRAILARAASTHLLANPIEAYHFIDAFTHAVSVDSTFTNAALRTLALQLAGLRGRNVTFLTAPWSGPGWRDGQSVVLLNKPACATLWQAVRHDSVAAWAKRHPGTVTPAAPY